MKLYRPVLIESAEQAEALPPGTIFWTQRPSGFRYDFGTVGKFGVALASDWTDEPDTLHALVPIEAEEEWKTLHEGAWHLKADEDDARNDATAYGTRRRYTTDWEETP